MTTNAPFWETRRLEEMTDEEWESVCDGCGQCCLNKLQDADTDEIYFTNVACNLLNIKSCRCRHYENRFEYEPDCIKLTRENLPTFSWLPGRAGTVYWLKANPCLPGIRCAPGLRKRCMRTVSRSDILPCGKVKCRTGKIISSNVPTGAAKGNPSWPGHADRLTSFEQAYLGN